MCRGGSGAGQDRAGLGEVPHSALKIRPDEPSVLSNLGLSYVLLDDTLARLRPHAQRTVDAMLTMAMDRESRRLLDQLAGRSTVQEPGRSVPWPRSTEYCSGVNSRRHCSSVFSTAKCFVVMRLLPRL